MKIEEVIVTDHAIQMWRKRVAKYGDDTVFNIIDIVKKSIPIRNNACLVRKEVGKDYRVNEGLEILFVLEPVDKGICRVITVLNQNEYNNYFSRPSISKGRRVRFERNKIHTKMNKDDISEQLDKKENIVIRATRKKSNTDFWKDLYEQ